MQAEAYNITNKPNIDAAVKVATQSDNKGLGVSPRPKERPKNFNINRSKITGLDTTLAKSVSSDPNEQELISGLLSSGSFILNNSLDNPILNSHSIANAFVKLLGKTPNIPDAYYKSLNDTPLDSNSLISLSPQAKENADFFMRNRTPEQVADIQNFLGITSDGTLGPKTKAAIANYTAVFGEISLRNNFPTVEAGKGKFNSSYFTNNYLAKSEGTEQGITLEAGGAITLAYGVTKEAAKDMGVNPDDYPKTAAGKAELAAAVATKHYQKLSKHFKNNGRSLENLPLSVQYALVDVHYNAGNTGETVDLRTTTDMMKNTLEWTGMTTKDGKTKASLLSLATRRAENWNKAAGDTGLTHITKVRQTPTATGTTYHYLAKDGGLIKEVTTTRKPVKILNDATYEILTKISEVDIK